MYQLRQPSGSAYPMFFFPRARCTTVPVPVPNGLMLTGPERNCFVRMWNVKMASDIMKNEPTGTIDSDIPLIEAQRQIGCISGSRCEIGR
jgi:hypothetical protein